MASVQSILNFERWDGYPQFETTMVCDLIEVIFSSSYGMFQILHFGIFMADHVE